MAGQDITFDEVAAAAQGLASEGKPVTMDSLRGALGTTSVQTLHQHLTTWRGTQSTSEPPPDMELPTALTAALGNWARQLAEDAAGRVRERLAQTETDLADMLQSNEQAVAQRNELDARLAQLTTERDQALARLAERESSVERLTIELRHARDIASDALVGKAKDQLAIEGKDAQLADLRQQLERHVASSAAVSDARLAAEMELVGATTARNNLAAEVAELRAQLDARRAG